MTTTSQITAPTEVDRLCVDTIGMLSIDAVQQANSGPSMFAFTHDSIGLGEDGPTHQPIGSAAMVPPDPIERGAHVLLAGRRSLGRREKAHVP
jgi:hypothetical protein